MDLSRSLSRKETVETVNTADDDGEHKDAGKVAAAVLEFLPNKDPESLRRRYQVKTFRCHAVAPIQKGIAEHVRRLSSCRTED